MALRRITAPTELPVSVVEMEGQCRADLTLETALVETYIGAVTDTAESYTRRALITQEWELTLDSFPEREIVLPLPPLQSVVSVKYRDAAGVEQTIDPSGYAVNTAGTPGGIVPAYGTSWPATLDMPGSVTIVFVCGYGAPAEVPPSIKAWIMLNAANLYENRETIVFGNIVNELSTMANSLLNPHRVVSW